MNLKPIVNIVITVLKTASVIIDNINELNKESKSKSGKGGK